MSDSKNDKAPDCNTLNFFYDDDNGSALTILVNGVRFHAFVDYDSLKSYNGKRNSIHKDYLELLSKLRDSDEPGIDHRDPEHRKHDSKSRTVPSRSTTQVKQTSTRDSARGLSSDSSGASEQLKPAAELYCICREPERGFMLGCDGGCDNWYHGECVGVAESDDSIPDRYICPSCERKDQHAPTQVRDGSDSGIDMGEDLEDQSEDENYAKHHNSDTDPEKALQNWILAPLAEEIQKHAPASNTPAKQTVHEWYNVKTYFYSLESAPDGKSILAVEQTATPELQSRMTALIPTLSMPQYIRNLPIPWLNPNDLIVLSASSEPEPFHPALVQHNSTTYFLKPVDPSQPGPTKREIKLLAQIERLGLADSQLSIPKVAGLVAHGDSKTHISGFLQTAIADPVPLTLKLDSEVPQEKRDRWAREAEAMVRVLHEHDIVWGDAKADNFVVDKDEKLWIIDFGGSYTEGWVDPELNETEEGDDMGVEKIVNALDDPDENTFDDDEEEEEEEEEEEKEGHKRVREDGDDERDRSSKRQKR